MLRARALLAGALLAGALLAAAPRAVAAQAPPAGEGWSAGLEQFFGSIDRDGDGQIGTAEALRYIGANFDSPDIQQDLRTAAAQMSSSLDGADSDSTISREEVETHLRKLLRGHKVTDWVRHSAQLPQYAGAFKENSITSLDFPMLVADGGAALEADLGVRSRLHREQLMRALKRVILGIGSTPSTPAALHCQPLSCDSVAVRWQPPARAGSPPLHKYRLERQLTQAAGASVPAPLWEPAHEELDDELTAWLDAGVQAGVVRYRLTAWNAMGWSEASVSPDCDTGNSSLPCPPGACRGGDCTGRALAAESGAGDVPGAASGPLRLLYSCAGILLAGLLAASLLLGSQQRGSLQASTWARGLGALDVLLLRQAQPGQQPDAARAPAEQPPPAGGLQAPEQQAAPARPMLDPVALGLVQTPFRRQLLHLDSGASRTSGRDFTSEGSSPRRRASLAPAGSGAELDSPHGEAALPSLRVRGSHRRLTGEQDVLWLDGDGAAAAGPLGEVPSSPHPAVRHGCGHPGCRRGLHPIFNPRAALTSHYCSICQNVFCHRHTRHSPHGRLGSCGMESKCICAGCWEELPRGTQERLERSNKLRSKQSGPASTVAVDTQAPPAPALGRGGSSASEHGSAARSAVERASSRGREAGGLQRRRSGQQSWSLLRAVFRASGRFRDAGRTRQQ